MSVNLALTLLHLLYCSNDQAIHIYFGDLMVKTEMESELKEQSLRVRVST